MKRFLIALGVSLGLVITAPVQAEAVTAVQVSVTSATPVTVKYDNCKYVSITIDGDFGGEGNGNSVNMDVTNEDTGDWETGDIWFDATSPFNAKIEVCGGYNEPGRYRVDVEVTSYDDATTATASTAFKVKMIPPKSSKVTRKVHRGARGAYDWSVPGQLLRAGHGYVGKWVRVEVRLAGSWWKVGSQKTHAKGRFSWVFKSNGYTFRYAYLGDSKTMESASEPFRTPGGHRRDATSTRGVDLASLVQSR